MTKLILSEMENKQLAITSYSLSPDFEEFTHELRKRLESQPAKTVYNEIASKAAKKDVYHVPIDIVEGTLDNEFTPVGWQTCNFNYMSMGSVTMMVRDYQTNQMKEVTKAMFGATIELKFRDQSYIEPVWISRMGASSAYVSAYQGTTFLSKLKAECVKNAAKSIGKIFGRSLNRGEHIDTSFENEIIERTVEKIQSIHDLSELINYVKTIQVSQYVMDSITDVYSAKWIQLFRVIVETNEATINSRESLVDFQLLVARDYGDQAKQVLKTDAECLAIMTRLATKYPKNK